MRIAPARIIMAAMFALLILAIAPQDDFAAYRAATRAGTPCSGTNTPGDVTVCGRREADRRYRVPLTGISPRDQVPRERAALLEDKVDHCGRQLMFTDCGMVGVTMTSGGAGTTLKPRKAAD